jgi:hypothetical protein
MQDWEYVPARMGSATIPPVNGIHTIMEYVAKIAQYLLAIVQNLGNACANMEECTQNLVVRKHAVVIVKPAIRENVSVSMGSEMMGRGVLCVRMPVAHLKNVMNKEIELSANANMEENIPDARLR